MNKFIRLSMLVALVAGFFLPAFPVSAQGVDEWENAQTTPGFVGTITENADLVQWVGNWTGRNIGYVTTHGRYTCVTPECSYAVDVYIEVTVHVTISDIPSGGPYILTVDGTGTNVVTVNCSTAGECAAHAFFVYPAADNETDPPWAGYFSITTTLAGQADATTSWDVDVKMTRSADQLNTTDCDDTYEPVDVIATATAIPVTSETGAAAILEAGAVYRVTVNGFWDDGESHVRRDTAIKQGEDDWVSTDELVTSETVLCSQVSVVDPSQVQFIFTAQDADWAIRVNDTVGDFADNTTALISGQPITYQIEQVQEKPAANCAGQYLSGETIGVISLSSSTPTGVSLRTSLGLDYPGPGEWYIIEVTGAWKNNGSGPDLQTIAIKHSSWSAWLDASAAPANGCYDEDSATYYMQNTAGDGSFWVRVADSDGTFTSNTGTLTLTIKTVASYTPYSSGCELEYQIGNSIETRTVEGDWSNGNPINDSNWKWDPMGGAWEYITPVRYYMLETYGGPVQTAVGDFTWDADLAKRGVAFLESQTTNCYTDTWGFTWCYETTNGDGWYLYERSDLEWYEIQTAPFVECVVPTDTVGHVKVFFAMDEQVDVYEFLRNMYAFRVRDTGDYANNTGSLSYRLYEATKLQYTDPGTEPEVDGCLQYAHDATALQAITLYGNDEDGAPVYGPLEENALYAIEVTGGPWTDNGVDSYQVQVSNDNGDTYTDLADYPYLLCSQSADGDHHLIYVRGFTGAQWRVRVSDGNTNFTDNADSITVTIYPGVTSIDPFPTCDDSYTLTRVPLTDLESTVAANNDDGIGVVEIVSGKRYSIAVTGDSAWYEAGGADPLYLLEISDDGGATWQDLETYDQALCVTMIGNGGRFQIYFDAVSGNYRLRVRDGDANYLTNSGAVKFDLYTAIDHSNPDSWDNVPDPQWVAACDQQFLRPNSLFEMVGLVPVPRVGDWIEYGKNAIISYFAWCPEHTEALLDTGHIYEDKEPLATIIYMADMAETIRTSVEGTLAAQGGAGTGIESMEPDLFSELSTTEDASGGAGYVMPANPLDILTVGGVDRSDNNPLFGGQLDLTTITGPEAIGGQSDYVAACTDKFYNLFGIGAQYYCNTMAMFRFTKFLTWVLLVVDVVALFSMINYARVWIARMWELFTGEKRTVRRLAQKVV